MNFLLIVLTSFFYMPSVVSCQVHCVPCSSCCCHAPSLFPLEHALAVLSDSPACTYFKLTSMLNCSGGRTEFCLLTGTTPFPFSFCLSLSLSQLDTAHHGYCWVHHQQRGHCDCRPAQRPRYGYSARWSTRLGSSLTLVARRRTIAEEGTCSRRSHN
jgi:hypothetical protein